MLTIDALSSEAREYFHMIGYMVEQHVLREGVIPERIYFVMDCPRRVRRELIQLEVIRPAKMRDGTSGFVHDVQREAAAHFVPVRH